MEGAGREKTVCVTGAGGFVASWLVKLLLSRGRYTVHGTVRDPGDGKNAHLAALDGAAERLRLFKADLLDNGSLAAAITGCDDVFHVACPVLANATPYPEVELLAPAVTGTTNILKACSDAKVKRVVVVSSVSAVMMNPNWPEGKAMDEDCWSDVEYCRTIEVIVRYKANLGVLWMFGMLPMLFFWYMKLQRPLDGTYAIHIQERCLMS